MAMEAQSNQYADRAHFSIASCRTVGISFPPHRCSAMWAYLVGKTFLSMSMPVKYDMGYLDAMSY